MLWSSSATAHTFLTLGGKKGFQTRDILQRVHPPQTLETVKTMFLKATANLACTRSLCVWSCGGKCRVGVAFVGSSHIPPGHFLSRRISTRMLESTWTVRVHVDLRLIRARSVHLMHSGYTAVLVIPRAFLQWEHSSSGTPWKHYLGYTLGYCQQGQQSQCTLNLWKRGSASLRFDALKTSCSW